MKDATESRPRLQGILNITVTPFKADGALDLSALAENIERVIHLGYDGILIGGTYGEFPAMNPAERADLFRRASDIVNDRVPVTLYSAQSDPRIVRELTALAGALGGVPMVTPPLVSEVTDDQIVESQKKLWETMRIAAEPGGATALAALLSGRYKPQPGERVGVVVCGGNTDAVDFASKS